MVANRERYQKNMETGAQFIWNLVDGRRTIQLPKLLLFFFKTLILEATKKQKLLNEKYDMFFIDSTSIKVSPDANKNKNNQEQSIGRSKGGLQRSCTYVVHLHVRWPFTCLLTTFTTSMKEANCLNPYISKIILIFWRTEFTKIIKLWLWLRIVGLRPLFHLKKNRKLPWNYYKHLHKQRNNIERYFLRLKRFRKVFTRYDKIDSIFISNIQPAFIFDLFFMWTLPKFLYLSRYN